MKMLTRFQSIFFIWFIICSISNVNLSRSNESNSPTSKKESLHSLRVSSRHYEPFVYQENGKFKGIEYNIIKAIAEKEHLNLAIHLNNGLRNLAFNLRPLW